MSVLVHDSAPRNHNQSFTSRKMDWLDAVSYDRRLLPIEKVVAWRVMQCANAKTGKAWPSQEWIAERVNTVERVVRRSLKKLSETGWLKIYRKRTYDSKTKTWKTRNVYVPLYGNVQAMLDLMKGTKTKPDSGVLRKPDSGVLLTPSYKPPQKGGESPEGVRLRNAELDQIALANDARAESRVLPLMRVVGGRS